MLQVDKFLDDSPFLKYEMEKFYQRNTNLKNVEHKKQKKGIVNSVV